MQIKFNLRKKLQLYFYLILSCLRFSKVYNNWKIKYGYAKVLREGLGEKLVIITEAFSTSFINLDNKAWSPKLSEKIKITEANFNGILKSRLSDFAIKIKSF